MFARPGPLDGDIVIREERHEGVSVYVLRTLPGADQLTTSHDTHSLEHALAFAKRAGVRAWLQTNGKVELLHDGGRVASV